MAEKGEAGGWARKGRRKQEARGRKTLRKNGEERGGTERVRNGDEKERTGDKGR